MSTLLIDRFTDISITHVVKCKHCISAQRQDSVTKHLSIGTTQGCETCNILLQLYKLILKNKSKL
jgi:hypothetical protein